ncbi:RCC1 and BTB domain-containing protein 1-like [Camponotus floridanus]|uniref:RCC1 and BTB domain-containing protein 1-like n=1 Tax=Camponotus floridanus TaxID=104421 RepID=UPI000DC67CA3|nr:RCC1 and BTB domain-containing protein 1-like [Camponotus floridanus]
MYSQSYPATCRYSDLKKWQVFYLLDNEITSQIHMFMGFDNDSALIMTKNGMVYSLGTNYDGELGLDKDYIQLKEMKTLCKINIKTFYCSIDAKSIFAVTEEGEVYSWGSNENCRLGRPELEVKTKIYMPAQINSLSTRLTGEHITDIACNNYICLALTDSGKIYTWGNIKYSSSYYDIVSTPYQVNFDIIHIACGSSFAMALNKDGKLYSWGLNNYGQLGINSTKENYDPCLITSLIHVTIVKVVCGLEHSLALNSEGKIYSWGSNSKGQLGHGKKTEREIKPVMLCAPIMGKISDIAAQDDKSVAINKIGHVYVWGHRVCYQIIWEPVRTQYSNIYDIFRYKIPYIIHDSTNEKSNILEYLRAAFNDLSTSDLTIKIGEQLLYVHKSILKIRCEYFRKMFQNNWAENNQSIIEHDQFSYNVYKAFLKYLYTDVVDHLTLEEIFELLKLCDEYNETKLEEKCIEIIGENITVSNVAFCYAKAIENNVKDLEEFCFQFALSQMTDVILSETFTDLNESLKLDFMIKAAKAGAYKT